MRRGSCAAFTPNSSDSTQASGEHSPLCGKCLDAARLHHQRTEKIWKQGVDRIRRVPSVRLLLGSTTETRRDLQHCRSHAETLRMHPRFFLRRETCRFGHYHGTQTGWLIFSPPLLSQDAAPPWMFVSPLPLQQQPEETRRKRHLIANFHTSETKSQIRVTKAFTTALWTADGRPHPAGTRTLQHAAHIASNRNGQQMSAKSLQRKWKQEIQMALLRRRASRILWHGQSGSSPVSLIGPFITGAHSNASVRSRHCLESERAADVGEIASAQVET